MVRWAANWSAQSEVEHSTECRRMDPRVWGWVDSRTNVGEVRVTLVLTSQGGLAGLLTHGTYSVCEYNDALLSTVVLPPMDG